jgi:YVTN family beta-propeller protein
VHPSGREVYVSNGADGTVMVIDTASNIVTQTIKVGNRPWNMGLTADGAKLYVANGRSNTVSVIDTATKKELKQIKVGDTPWGVAVPGGH